MRQTRSPRGLPLALALALGLLGLLFIVLFIGGGALAAPDKGKAGDELPGIDTSKLAPSEKAALLKFTDTFRSACGKPHSLRESLKSDPQCKRSQIAVQTMQQWFLEGLLPS